MWLAVASLRYSDLKTVGVDVAENETPLRGVASNAEWTHIPVPLPGRVNKGQRL